MPRASHSLTQGNLAKQILVFSLPLMLSNLLQVLFNMSDIAVVGRFAGSLALGSVGSTTTLVVLFTGFLIGMGNLLGIFSPYYSYNESSSAEAADRTALESDFGVVGQDLYSVMK